MPSKTRNPRPPRGSTNGLTSNRSMAVFGGLMVLSGVGTALGGQGLEAAVMLSAGLVLLGLGFPRVGNRKVRTYAGFALMGVAVLLFVALVANDIIG